MDMAGRAGRDINLDLVRLLACIAVVGLHTFHKELSIVNATLYYACGFAIPVFLMASGYILCMREDVDFRYPLCKAAGVLRLIILWNALISLAKEAAAMVFHTGEPGNFFALCLSGMLQCLVQQGTLWHFWYFAALIILYAFLAVVNTIPVSTKKKRVYALWLLTVAVSGAVQAASVAAGEPLSKYCIQTFRLWTWVQYFLLGGVLRFQSEKWRGKEVSGAHTVCLILATAWALLYQNMVEYLSGQNLLAAYFYDDLFFALWTVLLFTWLLRLRLKEHAIAFIRAATPLTTGVYILHPLVYRLIGHFWKLSAGAEAILYFGIVLAASFILAWIIQRLPTGKSWIEL